MKIILLCVCVVLVCKLDGQDMPLIHANSGSVDVEEDGIFLKGIWNLSPAVRPDVYGIMRSNKTKRVTFFTDMDSISFMVSASSVYDFIILLNERDSCYTRIMIIDPLPVRSDAEMPETIAFELGEDNFIHLPVSVNGSQPLDFIFDTGAGSFLLSDRSRDKNVSIKLDGRIENIGSISSQTQLTSSQNRLTLGNLSWEPIDILYIDYNGALAADGVIGSNAMESKVVEIDYDMLQLIIHDSLPSTAGFSANQIRYRSGQPFIYLTLIHGGTESSGWFLFDSGSKWSLSVPSAFSQQHGLYDAMESIGSRSTKGSDGVRISNETVLLDELRLGDLSLKQLPIDLEEFSENGGLRYGILGNDILKRFNAIIDYQNSMIYLKANGLTELPYQKPFSTWFFYPLGIVVILIGIAIRRRRSGASQQ